MMEADVVAIMAAATNVTVAMIVAVAMIAGMSRTGDMIVRVETRTIAGKLFR